MASPTYQVVDPRSGEVVETFPHATDDEVATAIDRSSAAFTSWRALPISERAAVVRRVGAAFAERADELAEIATTEMGKVHHEGVEEVELCQAIFDWFATEGPGLAADEPLKTAAPGTAMVQKLPVGPLLGVMPWNFPFYQIARFAAPNLVLGNTVLLKHAESVPRSALVVQEIMDQAGVPEGVYVNLFATHEQVETVIADPRVAGVSLTGSERAGSIVGALAGKHLKKCVLELGGSDPYVLLDTDDVAAAAKLAWDTRMYNAGQACNSNKRMIVMSEIYDDFVSELTALADAVVEVTPLSSRRAAEAVAEQVEDAVARGATLHAGGVLSAGRDAAYSPAVLTGVRPGMRAWTEELFGPVAVVYRVDSDEEALALANDTAYGLGGAVFSRSTARAQALAERLDVGMTNVNTPMGEGPEIPFGGIKRSGYGRELGPLAMDEFVNKRILFVADETPGGA
ncbi:succinate-semialdehyde dehydrogenase/glutarate-semialdehyde dehydrogenase [Nocardioides zeae]|uniref:Succinate-semialdehyde dehydrogenase/glutarate-semialdehyde dehydrogenase n=1 Tax=Nocardioides zeae TaxID=1457234 RepID=A0ACC6IDZ1_9ACTN|nr:NAD-dependent succinate-semialdehyde dehydrogenase [Nocardioides zeae]MDR6174176.1 succinate-semialdehyde dehydrogenase/glutarate-semialdehyde dehydrogenase [Nocardioides zeae]MDR6208983.1 succinate-semialdehyde dehydrogenase/glutarate-semialdehyde dehydrogenase [Nocardioides zeae]